MEVHCDEFANDLLIAVAWSAATDLILAAYPIIVFWNLQMPLRLKVGLCLLMGTGVFSCICACLKIYQIDRVNNVQDRTG